MGRKPLRKELTDAVARKYELLRREIPDRNISAAMVWEKLRDKNPPSRRKVEQLVAKFKSEGTPVVDSPWRPSWAEADKNPEGMARLLELQGAFLCLMGRPMYESEADWARRLYYSLGELYTFGQIVFIMLYAQRENVARLTEEEFSTSDLDGFLAISIPYGVENYMKAVEQKLVPEPPTTEQIKEVFDLEGSSKNQELILAFGDLMEEFPENPLVAIQKSVGESGSYAMKRATWNRTPPATKESTRIS